MTNPVTSVVEMEDQAASTLSSTSLELLADLPDLSPDGPRYILCPNRVLVYDPSNEKVTITLIPPDVLFTSKPQFVHYPKVLVIR